MLTGTVAADSRCYRATKSRLKSPLDRHTAESSLKVRSREGDNATRKEARLTLRAAEDNMNVQMENINVTQRDGRVTHLDRVYIRGSHVRLFIVPDMLRYVYMGGTGIGWSWNIEHVLTATTGTRPCSDLVVPVVVVLVLREVGLQSTVPADNAVALDKPLDRREGI